jgi:GPH family glycoside/pentoside/hexuronide:cation symporter
MNAPSTEIPSGRLPTRFKMLFSTGDLSTSIPLAILMFFQLYFLTDVALLRPDYAAWAIALPRLWDAINDPLFGLISDRLRTRWGRRRVLLLFGAVPLGLSFVLMWIVPPFSQVGLAVYYALTFIVFDTAFTAVHVGYNSLTPELTSDYDERSSLNGYRMVFSISGTLGAIILATVLGWFITDARLLFMILGLGLGLASIIPPLIVFNITHEKPADELPEPLSWFQSMKMTLSNQPFRFVMGLYLLSWTTASILAAMLVYFANYRLRVPEQANYFVLVAQGSAIFFIPFWVWVAQKQDKRRAFMLGTLTWIVVLLGISALPADAIGWAYLLAALSGSGIATAYVLPWSMIPDIIEYDQVQTGQRREGSYYAFASFFQKLATALALWGMGQAFAFTGYITPETGGKLPVQPESVVQAIRIFTGPIPAVLLILAVLFAWKYPITRETHKATLQELAKREA